jgi:hypothetical protein
MMVHSGAAAKFDMGATPDKAMPPKCSAKEAVMRKAARVLTFLATLCPAALWAQQQQTPGPARVAEVERVLKSDLRNLVVAQESYYSDHNTYATSVAELSNLGLYDTSDGVTAIVILSSNRGWNGVAVHEGVHGLRCAMYVGDAAPPLANNAVEGEASCIGPGS